MSIKKVVMYVDINDGRVLKDDYYKESFDWRVKNGMSVERATKLTSKDALESIMRDVFCDERFVNDYEYDVDNADEEDAEDFAYRELVDRIERNKIHDEEKSAN